MDKGWKDIQAQINQKEEPLSETAWEKLEKDLNNGNRGRFLWLILLLLLLVAPIFLIDFNTDRHEELPATEREHNTVNIENENAIKAKSAPQTKEAQNTKHIEQQPQSTATSAEQANTKTKQTQNANQQTAPSTKTDKVPVDSRDQRAEEKRAQIENAGKNKSEEAGQTKELAADHTITHDHEAAVGDDSSVQDIQGQQENNQPRMGGKYYRWEIKAYGGLTVTSANVNYQSEPGFTHKDLMTVSENGVESGFGYDAGVEVSYFIAPHFKVSSGIGLRTFTTQNALNYEVSDIPVIDSATGQILGYLPTGQPANYQDDATNSYTYFSVPISLFYEHRLSNRWSVTGEFVNTAQFLIQQSSQTINTKDLSIQATENDLFNRVIFSYQIRAGLRYYLNEKTAMSLEPAYRGHYNNIYNSSIIDWRPTDWSLTLGIIYKLGLSQPKKK